MDLAALMQGMKPIQDAVQQQDAARAGTVFEGRAGGGAVTVAITGELAVRQVRIAPAAAQACAGDVTMLEDLVAGALADALGRYRARYGASSAESMQKLMAGMDLGALLKR